MYASDVLFSMSGLWFLGFDLLLVGCKNKQIMEFVNAYNMFDEISSPKDFRF